jgi:hypothetical protein
MIFHHESFAGGSGSSGFGAMTYSMYPVGFAWLDQWFHFGQSTKPAAAAA